MNDAEASGADEDPEERSAQQGGGEPRPEAQ